MDTASTADSLTSAPSPRWTSLARATGLSGLATVGLVFASTIAVSSVGEPPLDASSEDAATFFRSSQTAWAQAATATASLAMMGILWFVAGLALILRRAEGDPPWRSGVALASGILVAAYGVLDASWDAAAHRADQISPELAGYAFTVGNIGFANAWLAMASLAGSTGWIILRTRVLPRWIGYSAAASGIGLIVARYLWFIEGLWFLPYALFWIWIIGTCERLIRNAAAFPSPHNSR